MTRPTLITLSIIAIAFSIAMVGYVMMMPVR